MSVTSTDCLVLKLEEFDSDRIDTTMYVIYDKRNNCYLIRGTRRMTHTLERCEYSYQCEFENELADFIQYCFCPENKVEETLYNYSNLPENPDDITFDFLNEHDYLDYEIAGYNLKKLKRSRILRNLRMLRNVFNYY